jgi:hypothetical protein
MAAAAVLTGGGASVVDRPGRRAGAGTSRLVGLVLSNRYSVRPLASTRIRPDLGAGGGDRRHARLPATPEVVPGEPYAAPPELPEPLEPEVLLLHPAAIAPTTASATNATTGRPMTPILLGRGRGRARPPSGKRLLTNQLRICASGGSAP